MIADIRRSMRALIEWMNWDGACMIREPGCTLVPYDPRPFFQPDRLIFGNAMHPDRITFDRPRPPPNIVTRGEPLT